MNKQHLKYYFAFFLLALLAFWQISFYVHPVKYDMTDCYFPWRYYIGESLQHGKFPYWNPYQTLGYPIHADPGSGTWYPVVWFIGYFFGYGIYTMGLEFWLHVFVAGIGFFHLARTLKFKQDVAFLLAISYLLCGVFVGNAQHLGYVVSACWLPFVLSNYIKLSERSEKIYAIKAGFFLFLMITGGYPSFTIILFYLLLFYFLRRCIAWYRDGQQQQISAYVFRNVLFAGTALLLSAGFLLSLAEVAPYITRTNGFELRSALIGPFGFRSFLSFVFPYASVKDPDWFGTDMSMSNGYLGLLMFLFLLPGLFMEKPKQLRPFFYFGLFALSAAVGSTLPVREFLYNHVPMMNIFRFPSVFRVFGMVGFLLVSGWWLQNFLEKDDPVAKRRLGIGVLVFISILLFILVLARLRDYLDLKGFLLRDVFTFSTGSTFIQHMAFQTILQIGLLAVFYWFLKRSRNSRWLLRGITMLVVVDLFISTQLNAPYTAFYPEFSAKATSKQLNALLQPGFPQLPNKNISEVDPHPFYFGPFWKNVNIFQKQVSAEGFNSFVFSGYDQLRDSFPQLHSAMIRNKLAYLSADVHNVSELHQMRHDSAFRSSSLFFASKELHRLGTAGLEHVQGDSAALVHFSPDSMVVHVHSQGAQLLTLLQSNYQGWHVTMDGNEQEIITANKVLMSTPVSSGDHEYIFYYRNSGMQWLVRWSIASFLLVGFYLLWNRWRGHEEE